ncbi:MAG: DNA-3-methyladenine glycosylase, partial [Actinomycetota bacterium]|nr:DNA-3-methyladenine glycosylase [Actinomycetota bacterium]
VADSALARGPACLTRALGIDGRHNGDDLGAGGPLTLMAGEPPSSVAAGPRVGVSRAADRPWRFWVAGAPTVTAYRRSPRASLHR